MLRVVGAGGFGFGVLRIWRLMSFGARLGLLSWVGALAVVVGGMCFGLNLSGAIMAEDKRSFAQVVREYEQLERLRKRLIEAGHLSGDASRVELESKLRELCPAGLMRSVK
jgi:hypothetical protein